MINNQELSNITGGAFKYGVAVVIGGIATFVIGLIDGYLRPSTCRK